MSVLVVGLSHHSAPLALLERLALDSDGVQKLVHDLAACSHVTEATVIATCNRLEVYAEVDRFHGSVEEVSGLLVERAGCRAEELVPSLYVHYDDGAVAHLFAVASGLDSMAVGEAQILGQTREALRVGQELGTVGPALNGAFQQALRVAKRAHAETAIDQVAPTLVDAALGHAAPLGIDLVGAEALVVGAGAMAGLATATLARAGVGSLTVVNRTPERASRLAASYDARSASLDALHAEVARAQVVVSCTGATGLVLPAEAFAGRGEDVPVLVADLALPHDVDPAAADLPGVTLVTLADLTTHLEGTPAGAEVEAVRGIVEDEVNAFLRARRQASVTPTVVALRSMATSVVEAELARLDTRLPDLDDRTRAEVLQTLRRVADKLVHQPTVRVRELANETGAVSYAAALAELFALDPEAVTAVTRPEPLS